MRRCFSQVRDLFNKEKLKMKRVSALKMIRQKCLDCCAGNAVEVRLCILWDCPLWPYRMGKKPAPDRRPEVWDPERVREEVVEKIKRMGVKDAEERVGEVPEGVKRLVKRAKRKKSNLSREERERRGERLREMREKKEAEKSSASKSLGEDQGSGDLKGAESPVE